MIETKRTHVWTFLAANAFAGRKWFFLFKTTTCHQTTLKTTNARNKLRRSQRTREDHGALRGGQKRHRHATKASGRLTLRCCIISNPLAHVKNIAGRTQRCWRPSFDRTFRIRLWSIEDCNWHNRPLSASRRDPSGLVAFFLFCFLLELFVLSCCCRQKQLSFLATAHQQHQQHYQQSRLCDGEFYRNFGGTTDFAI